MTKPWESTILHDARSASVNASLPAGDGTIALDLQKKVRSSHEGIAPCPWVSLGIPAHRPDGHGCLIRNGNASLRTAHFHSGSLMVLVALAYIALSLTVIFSKPETDEPMNDLTRARIGRTYTSYRSTDCFARVTCIFTETG